MGTKKNNVDTLKILLVMTDSYDDQRNKKIVWENEPIKLFTVARHPLSGNNKVANMFSSCIMYLNISYIKI